MEDRESESHSGRRKEVRDGKEEIKGGREKGKSDSVCV